MIYTNLMKDAWASLYDPTLSVNKVIDKYFHQDYEQCINGVVMNLNQYIEHVSEQRQNMTVETIDYKYILEKDKELFALYFPRGKNIENNPVEAEVIVYLAFQNKKIHRIHGQVRLIKGDLTDVDM